MHRGGMVLHPVVGCIGGGGLHLGVASGGSASGGVASGRFASGGLHLVGVGQIRPPPRIRSVGGTHPT